LELEGVRVFGVDARGPDILVGPDHFVKRCDVDLSGIRRRFDTRQRSGRGTT